MPTRTRTIWEAVLPLFNDFARVPVSGLIAQYNGVPAGDGTDRLPATMRQILSKRLTIGGFINYDFAAEHYADFLREVGAGGVPAHMGRAGRAGVVLIDVSHDRRGA